MSWRLYRWVWELESPLHIGLVPAGSLNRTRLYIPARTIWGALTAELARKQSPSQFPDYRNMGEKLKENMRFTYLFPAEKEGDQWFAWLPEFNEGDGFIWRREDDNRKLLTHRLLRRKLLIGTASTAIDPLSDTAHEETLRDIELISPYWRCENNDFHKVAMVGYVFLRNDDADMLRQVQRIFVGGDIRYGFGRIKLESFEEAHTVFNRTVILSDEKPTIESDVFLGHTKVCNVSIYDKLKIYGNLELIAGWDFQRQTTLHLEPCWMPGSKYRISNNESNDNLKYWLYLLTDGLLEIGQR